MKKLIISILIVMACVPLLAQEVNTYTENFDKMFININKDNIITGILYDRVVPFAHLTKLSQSRLADTINADLFLQGYSELYHAAYHPQQLFCSSVEDVKNSILLDTNVVDIGVLHYNFDALDTLMVLGNLYFDRDSILWENSGNNTSIYKQYTTFLASAMVKYVFTPYLTFRWQNLFYFDNTQNQVAILFIDMGDGTGEHQLRINDQVSIFLPDTGIYHMTIRAVLQDGITHISKSKITYKSASRESHWPYKATRPVTAQIHYPNIYTGGTFACNGGDLSIYYAHSNMLIRKPILVIDGFDPGNKRRAESYQGDDPYGKSIWEQLDYQYNGTTLNVGRKMLELGYDVIFLDLPDGGGFIEQNAMVCVQTINLINDYLQQNNSKEEIVIIGPSMGGQITRFALAYMESHPNDSLTHYGKHNCRLWVSFDSPHQGANISLGAQAFMHFYGYIGGQQVAKDVWNQTVNCPAAKQMLIKQYNTIIPYIPTTFSTCTLNINYLTSNPYYATYYQNLNNMGYPSQLRKIAISNGNLAGVGLSGCQEAIDSRIMANIRLSKICLYPSSGVCEMFYGMYTTILDYLAGHSSKLWIRATADNNNSSIDAAPGGTYNTFAQIKDALNSMDQVKSVTMSLADHCFMPYSTTLGLSGNMTYTTNIANRNMVAEHKTPFDSYKGVLQNMNHVALNQEIVIYLLNEIETYIQGDRTIESCEEKIYSVHLPDNVSPNTVINWTCSPNFVILGGQGTSRVTVKCIGTNSNSYISAEATNLTSGHIRTLKQFAIEVTSNGGLPAMPTEISQNTTWNTPAHLTETVHVRSGATLTINADVFCDPVSSIQIHPGAKVIVDGATINSTCNAMMWKGIVVDGDRNYRSYDATHQGRLTLKNGASVMNAENGVLLNRAPAYVGGAVTAKNAHFINNMIAVNFGYSSDYQRSGDILSSYSHFTQCSFEVNDDYLSIQHFKYHISLKSVNNIKFEGCSFVNDRQGNNAHEYADCPYENSAIYSSNSGFSVNSFCNLSNTDPHLIVCICPDTDLIRSTFRGFRYGIVAFESTNGQAVKIDQADFINNVVGIELNALHNASITRSNFEIGNHLFEGAVVYPFCGMKLLNTTGFKVEDNHFEPFISSYPRTIGLYISNSGAANNVVYKNVFSKLCIGQQFVGINRGENLHQGLQSLCNEHVENSYKDIEISTNEAPYLNGIRFFQGGQLNGSLWQELATGNNFSNGIPLKIDNNTFYPIDYQYSNAYLFENPNPSYNVFARYTNTVNSCPSRSYNPCAPVWLEVAHDLLELYQGYKTIYDRESIQFHNLIDAGDFQQLVYNVERTWAGDIRRIKSELMNISPYLSQNFLRYLGQNSILPHQDYMDVCLENPEATADYDFMTFLQNDVLPPFSARETQQIASTWHRFSVRGNIEQKLSAAGELKDITFDEYLGFLLTDSVDRDREISDILIDRAYLTDIYTLVERMIAQARFDEAFRIVTSHYRFLTDMENRELDNFVDYVIYREHLNNNEKTIYTLEEEDIRDLISFSNHHFGRAKILADNILCYLYNRCPDDEPNTFRRLTTSWDDSAILNETRNSSASVNVYPNPASQYCIFEYALSENEGEFLLQIFDKVGKTILSQPLSETDGSWRWNCKEVSAGMYYYRILKNNGMVATGKVVVK